ncbi:MAG TPA: hypothetical protein VNO70_08470 [Blastocatellia bacterium]|nr:hypothetical protein [Blastocatellia bacterium]
MMRRMLLWSSLTVMISLLALAQPASAQSPTIKVTSVAVGQPGGDCPGPSSEIDCIDVAWAVSNPSNVKIDGFDVSVKVTYTGAGSNTGSKSVDGAARKAKVGVFHQGSGGLKSFEVTIKAFLLIRGAKKTVATATRTGNF